MGLGPPLGAGWVANAFWGRITPCCLAATRSKAHSLIHSDGSVCGIQGRCSTRASLSAGPTCFCTHQVSLYPSATAPGTKGGRYSASSGSLGRSPLRLHPPGGRTPLATERSSRKKYLPGWNRTTSRPDYSRALSHLSYCQFPGRPARLRRYPDGSNWRVAQCPPFRPGRLHGLFERIGV